MHPYVSMWCWIQMTMAVCTLQPSTPSDDKVAVLMQDSGLSSHQTTATTLVSEGADTPMTDLTGLYVSTLRVYMQSVHASFQIYNV